MISFVLLLSIVHNTQPYFQYSHTVLVTRLEITASLLLFKMWASCRKTIRLLSINLCVNIVQGRYIIAHSLPAIVYTVDCALRAHTVILRFYCYYFINISMHYSKCFGVSELVRGHKKFRPTFVLKHLISL